jgi:hypothetical protein
VGKKRASISDKLEALTHQDERTAAGLVIILRALADRYPTDVNLAFATKAVAEFCAALTAGAAPATPEEPRG